MSSLNKTWSILFDGYAGVQAQNIYTMCNTVHRCAQVHTQAPVELVLQCQEPGNCQNPRNHKREEPGEAFTFSRPLQKCEDRTTKSLLRRTRDLAICYGTHPDPCRLARIISVPPRKGIENLRIASRQLLTLAESCTAMRLKSHRGSNASMAML